MTTTKNQDRSKASLFVGAQIEDQPNAEQTEHDDSGMDSADEALMEMLGLTSLGAVVDEEEMDKNKYRSIGKSTLPILTEAEIALLVDSYQLQYHYKKEAVCIFPSECSISAEHMRRLTDELVWGGAQVQADKTYETVHVCKQGEVYAKQALTRLEHFVDAHEGWSALCHNYLRSLVSKVLGVDMVLYKEKLNIKPPGGSGFAPHLDTPSLRVALGKDGPQTFCTVMVAIDDMTITNGCLRICKGEWSEDNCVSTIAPDEGGNPDAGGRAGAIPLEVADTLEYDHLVCKGGTIAVFNGWAPHRSAANTSPFPRRAVFLTYNSKQEGDFHKQYYEKMDEMRQRWRESVALAPRHHQDEEEQMELEALSTIPKI